MRRSSSSRIILTSSSERSSSAAKTSGEIACFIAEPIQGVGGTVTPPPDYFKVIYEIVRKYGGLCVSDEVQTGFGRTGERYWGFQTYGVLPDMVTMAKGIASKLNVLLTSLTAPEEGLLDSRINSYEKQIENLADRIADFDERLTLKRERLMLQFQQMETVLGQLGAQGDAIVAQAAAFNTNWGQINS